MTKSEAIRHITEAYDDMPEDTDIEGFFLVTITEDERILLAHGEVDLTQLQAALSSFHENTEG